MIYLGADHRGYGLKEKTKIRLSSLGYKYEDCGNGVFDKKDDYIDFAVVVAKKVKNNPSINRGILFCGSGTGMLIAANKFKKIRAALAMNEKIAKLSREHNNCNILCIPSDFLNDREAEKIIKVWLNAKFSKEGRHLRRIKKIERI
jgi:ribose 5-phosphate isomerase B